MIAELAARQHGLVTLAQLVAEGFDKAAISRRVRNGALHRVHRGVYAVGHAALSREGRWLAATLAADGALSHLSAAELWRIARNYASLIAVVSLRRRVVAGAHVHWCRTLDPRDIVRVNGIRVTTVARTLVDLSDVLIPEDLARVIHEAAYFRRFSLPATRDAMARANGRHNLDGLEQALAMHAAGSAGLRSRLERAFLSLLQLAGIDEPPRTNEKLHGFEVDLHWPQWRLVIEVDGPGHERPKARRDDALEDRVLTAAGYKVLRFTEEDVEQRPDQVLAALNAEARARRAPAIRSSGGFGRGTS